MQPNIKEAILSGRVVLLLGAGASRTSTNKFGKPLMDGWELAKALAKEAGLPYNDEQLPVVYAACKAILGDRLPSILEQSFKHARPSAEYETLSRFPWARIYTLNVDDALEKAFRANSPQHVNVRNRFDKIVDRSPFFDEVDIVKLNGNVDRLSDGLIFSPQEYGAASAAAPLWYEELARDFFRYVFIFVGTKLAEPLFFHQIERFRQASASTEGESYVLTPSASPIESAGLRELNLKHIPASLADFTRWLVREISPPPATIDIARRYHPQIDFLATSSARHTYLELFENVVRVSRSDLSSHVGGSSSPHRVRDFYRGFKPTWGEILSDVPARLRVVGQAVRRLKDAAADEKLFVIYGPAGSGKTTALMQVALALSTDGRRPVYLLSESIKNVRELLFALEESSNGPYYFCIDRLTNVADSVLEVLRSGRLVHGAILATERQNVWLSRTESTFSVHSAGTFPIELIDSKEADDILVKLEAFGPWHRLSKMSSLQRREELLKKSNRQLLIGLLEATAGRGFDQIIEKDYAELDQKDAKLFVVLVGFATIHQHRMPEAVASRALRHLGIVTGIPNLLDRTSGIVRRIGDALAARHPIYVERLFDTVVSKEEKSNVIHALLNAFAAYERPLMKSVGRSAGAIFKLNINHNFLKNSFHGDRELVLNVYESFSKAFQDDGLFWLQFGLALRDSGLNDQALEKLRIAHETHRLRQADHAYAQQLLILAEMGSSKTIAMAYLQEAKLILDSLDVELSEFDGDEVNYPIVTLSEKHTAIVLKVEGLDRARELAKHYANILSDRRKENPRNERLKQCWKKLTHFATGGEWAK